MAGRIRTEKKGATGFVVFDHPERHNAIDRAMWEGIPRAVAELDADPTVRVIVLRGDGDKAFVSGADISEFEQSRIGPGAADYNESTDRAFEAIEDAAKPTIAAIHGFCIGGGTAITLTADLRYAADDAVFALPPARLGLGYGARNVERLVHVVGDPFAREMLFTARRVSAEDAERIGLVHHVLPKAELDDHVARVAAQLAENAPLTIRAAKATLRELRKAPEARDMPAIERAIHACFESEDYAEGVRAFLDKRSPRFHGK